MKMVGMSRKNWRKIMVTGWEALVLSSFGYAVYSNWDGFGLHSECLKYSLPILPELIYSLGCIWGQSCRPYPTVVQKAPMSCYTKNNKICGVTWGKMNRVSCSPYQINLDGLQCRIIMRKRRQDDVQSRVDVRHAAMGPYLPAYLTE